MILGLKQRLHIPVNSRPLLIGIGGIPTKLPLQEWPVEKEIYYLIPDSWPMAHPHARHFQQCDLSFIDMLSSCDALITKPGYGNFSEAACNNIPVLYLKREDWPEEPYFRVKAPVARRAPISERETNQATPPIGA